jgi:predicted metalloprotease with PDZ domain
MADERKDAKLSLGARTSKDGNDCKLANVYEGGPAHKAGLSAGDILVALDGVRVTHANLDAMLDRYRAGDKVTLHAFRRDELMAFNVRLTKGDVPQVSFTAEAKPVGLARARSRWLSTKG